MFDAVPFSTDLLAEFLQFRLAIRVYWLNMLALGVSLYASWTYAIRTNCSHRTQMQQSKKVCSDDLGSANLVGWQGATMLRPSLARRRSHICRAADLRGRAFMALDYSYDR